MAVPLMTMRATSTLTPATTAITVRPRRNQSRSSSTSTTTLSRKSQRQSSAMKVEPPSKATTTAATDDAGAEADAGDDYARIGVDDYCDPLKKEPGPKLGCGDGEADDDYGPPDVNDYPLKEEPKSESIDIYYHPIKEESEAELGDGNCNCDPPKDDPGLVAAGDDTDDDGGPDVGYDCSHCGIRLGSRKFKVKHELRCKVQMHQREFESEITKLYHCGYCRCPFVNKELKELHQQKRCRKRSGAKKKPYGGPYFRCDECEYVAKWKTDLEKHLLKHNKDNAEWFTCTQCSYTTVHKRNLPQHMNIHSNSFSCCCPICGKSFRTKGHLDNHLLRRHSDESDEVSKLISSKVYTCNICEKYRTTKKTAFNEHLTVTHLKGVGREKYECPRCPYSTFLKGCLTRHSKTHTEQKDYQCIVCKKLFVRKLQLNSHILSNHADNVDLMKTITSKIHGCESCSFRTVKVTHLKRHVQSKHV